MSEKHQMTVRILDAEYQLLTDDDPEKVQMVAEFVDKLVRETKYSAPFISNMSAVILTALNISEELYKSKNELDAYKDREDDYRDLASYKNQLAKAKEETDAAEKRCFDLQAKADSLEKEKEETAEYAASYKEKYNELMSENEQMKKASAELQNKLLENQIELVKARKIILDLGE